MTKSELIDKIHSKSENLTKRQTEQVVDTLLESIKDALAEGDKVEIRGFGNFRVRKRDARKARNPRTGKVVEVPPKIVPYFKAGKGRKEMVEQGDR